MATGVPGIENSFEKVATGQESATQSHCRDIVMQPTKISTASRSVSINWILLVESHVIQDWPENIGWDSFCTRKIIAGGIKVHFTGGYAHA